MRKVAVIGLGHVGITTAYTLFTHVAADEIMLIDLDKERAQAEVNDLRDAVPRNDAYVRVVAGDYADLKNIDVIVTAYGSIAASAEKHDRFAELPINIKNSHQIGKMIKESGFHGIIINISNPCDAITYALQESTGLPKEHVFGTGTFLDTARMQRYVAEEVDEDPQSINGFALGEHGNSQFIAWSTVEINARKATELFDKKKQAELADRIRNGAFRVSNGKGFTSYAIATCGYRMVQAVFSDSKLLAPASVYVPSVKTYIGYPAVIGADGVEKIPELELTDEEQKEFEHSAAVIREHLAKYSE